MGCGTDGFTPHFLFVRRKVSIPKTSNTHAKAYHTHVNTLEKMNLYRPFMIAGKSFIL